MADIRRAKRTKTVGRKRSSSSQGTHGGSSSSTIDYTSLPMNWFVSPLARDLYNSFKPLKDLQFHFDSSLFNSNLEILEDWFKKIGLFDFVVSKDQTFDPHVKMFYANMTSKSPSLELTTNVCGKAISITPSLLGEILGLPNEGIIITNDQLEFDDFFQVICDNPQRTSTSKPTTSELSIQTRILFLYFSHLLAKQGSHTDYPKIQQNIVYCVKSGIPFNLPNLIIETMHSRKQFRPFHMTLSRVFDYFDIDLSSQHSYSVDQCIDKGKLSARLGFKRNKDGIWVRSRGKQPIGDEDEEQLQEYEEYVDNRIMELEMGINNRLDIFDSKIDQVQADIGQIQANVSAILEHLNRMQFPPQ